MKPQVVCVIIALCWISFASALAGAQPALDESLAEAEDWGYRPATGAAAELNPPSFTWRPTKGLVSFTLEIAADEAFTRIVYTRSDIPWNAHCPDVTFPPGAYFWRYSGATEAGERSPWSTVRAFSIPAGATPFPQPGIAELLRRMPSEHPRLFFRPEDIPALKSAGGDRLAARWQSLLEQADKLLKAPPDTSEPPRYPEGMKRGSGEWKKMWWGNRLRGIAVADSAATLGFAYRLTGDERYGKAARDLLMAITTWDVEGSTAYAYNDEAAMPLLYQTSRAYDWAYPMLSEADRTAVIAMMRARGTQCFNHLQRAPHLWRPYSSHSNRAWHFLGELAIAFHGDIPEAERWLDFAMTVFYTAYPVWSDSDGGWFEGAAYWSSYLNRFMYWAAVIRPAFGIDVFERPFFKRAGDFGLYLMPPGTKTGAFGDQAPPITSDSIGPLMASFAAGARNPYWKWYADAVGADIGDGYLGYLAAAHAGDIAAKAPDDLPVSVQFRGTGLAVLNTTLLDGTANRQLVFKSSPMGRQSHGYNANNAFLLHLNGQRTLICTGMRDVYGSPHHKDWMWDSRSDNAILVNGEGQIKHSARATGRISAFATSPSVDVVAGEAGDSYEHLERWTRRIVFFKPGLILIHDLLVAKKPSTFQWNLHAPGAFDLGENEATWSGKAGHVRARFLEPAGLALSQTDAFTPPPAEWSGFKLSEWHLTADCQEKASIREFLTLIEILEQPGQPRAEVDMTRANGGLGKCTVKTAAGDATVILDPQSFSVSAPTFNQTF